MTVYVNILEDLLKRYWITSNVTLIQFFIAAISKQAWSYRGTVIRINIICYYKYWSFTL